MQPMLEGHPQIEWTSAGWEYVQTKPEVLPDPVVRADTEIDSYGPHIYGSVLHDGGRFRMWYQALPRGYHGQTLNVGYAESDDGLTWRKPKLGVLDFGGSSDHHLTDMPLESPSVWIDPTADEAQRYRAFGFYTNSPYHPPKATGWGYFTMYSADGLRWHFDRDMPTYPGNDVITSAWDPSENAALVVFKQPRSVRGFHRRSMFTSYWTRNHVTPWVSALIPDQFDDVVAQTHGFNSADYYGLTIMPQAAKGITMGLLWVFRHALPMSQNQRRSGVFGRTSMALVYQVERGGAWQFVPGRPDFLRLEELPDWCAGGVYGSAFPIDVGDETWLYFSGARYPHAWQLNADWTPRSDADKLQHPEGESQIGLARWPRGRMLGYRTGLPETMQLIASPALTLGDIDTPPREDVATQLRLNVKTTPRGAVRVALVNRHDDTILPGFGFDDCEPITGDHRDVEVRWKQSPTSITRAPDMLLAARIEATDTTLYGFEFNVRG